MHASTNRHSGTRAMLPGALLAVFLVSPGALVAEPGPEHWLPGDVIGFVRVREPAKTLRRLLESDLRKQVEATAIYRHLREERDGRKLLDAIDDIESGAGRDAIDVVDDVLGRDMIVGVRLTFPPSVLFIGRSRSAAALEKGVESLKAIVRHKNDDKFPRTESRDHGGVTIETTAGGHVSWAVKGDTLFISNSARSVEDMIDLASGKGPESLAKSEAFAAALEGNGNEIATAAFRPQFVPDFRLPEHADNPLGSLVASGWLEALRVSDLVSFRLLHDDDGVRLRVDVNAKKELGKDAASIFFPTRGAAEDAGELAFLESGGLVGLIHMRRDIAKWWHKRDQFLDERRAADLLNANTFLSIFFGGVSFQDEVLPELEEGVTVVSRRLSYDGLGGTPQPQIPGFAVIFRLKESATLAQRVSSAFFQLITVINLNRGQNNKGAPFVLRSEKVGDFEMSVADLNPIGREGGELGIEYNFSPSLSVVGNRIVFGSNKELVRELIDELARKRSKKNVDRTTAIDAIRVRGAELRKLLDANLEFLTNAIVIGEGISADEARGRLHAIGEIIDFFDGLSVTTRFGDGAASLEVSADMAARGTTVRTGARSDRARF